MDLNQKILGTSDFTFKEFIRSNTATRYNIPNIPNDDQWINLTHLVKYVLQPIRDEFGIIIVSSGFRSIKLNKKIKGSKHSNHCKGEAADIIPPSKYTLIEVMEWIYNNLEFRELIYEYGEWIHVGYRINGNIKKLKLKDRRHDYTEIPIEYLKVLSYV